MFTFHSCYWSQGLAVEKTGKWLTDSFQSIHENKFIGTCKSISEIMSWNNFINSFQPLSSRGEFNRSNTAEPTVYPPVIEEIRHYDFKLPKQWGKASDNQTWITSIDQYCFTHMLLIIYVDNSTNAECFNNQTTFNAHAAKFTHIQRTKNLNPHDAPWAIHVHISIYITQKQNQSLWVYH